MDTPNFNRFLYDLAALCNLHEVTLWANKNETIDVVDAVPDDQNMFLYFQDHLDET